MTNIDTTQNSFSSHWFRFFVTIVIKKEYRDTYDLWFRQASEGYLVLRNDRRSGRTTFFALFALFSICHKPQELTVFLSHNHRAMMIAFDELAIMAKNASGMSIYGVSHVGRYEIQCSLTGSQLVFGWDPVRLKARTIHTLVLDNAELYTDDQWLDAHRLIQQAPSNKTIIKTA